MTGLGVSTVCTIVNKVTKAIVENMWEECVTKHVPNSEEEFKKKMMDMEKLWQFPCCWSAIDCCHIPVKCPLGDLQSCKEYYNFKNFYSIVMMGMVDLNYRFVWGTCGFLGSSHNDVILQSTQLWADIKEHGQIPDIGKKTGEVLVPPLVHFHLKCGS